MPDTVPRLRATGVSPTMGQNVAFKLVVTGIVCALAVWFLYPSVLLYTRSYDDRMSMISDNPRMLKKIVNLGLDLQGGMRLVLQLIPPSTGAKLDHDALERAFTVIENRINALGVAEPLIQKQGSNRLIVELPGLRDPKTAKEVIGSTALLEFKLVQEAERFEKAVGMVDEVLAPGATRALDSLAGGDSAALDREELEQRAQELFEGASVSPDSGLDSASGILLSELLYRTGQQSWGAQDMDVGWINEVLSREEVRTRLSNRGFQDCQFLWGYESAGEGRIIMSCIWFRKRRFCTETWSKTHAPQLPRREWTRGSGRSIWSSIRKARHCSPG